MEKDQFNLLLTEIQKIHIRFDGVDQQFLGIDQRFLGIERRLDGMDQRFTAIERRLDGMDQRFTAIEHRLDSFERRFDSFQSEVGMKLSAISTQVAHLTELSISHSKDLSSLKQDMKFVLKKSQELDQRIFGLENPTA